MALEVGAKTGATYGEKYAFHRHEDVARDRSVGARLTLGRLRWPHLVSVNFAVPTGKLLGVRTHQTSGPTRCPLSNSRSQPRPL